MRWYVTERKEKKGILIGGNESQHAIVRGKVECTMLERCSSGYMSDPRIMYLEQEVEKIRQLEVINNPTPAFHSHLELALPTCAPPFNSSFIRK